MEVEPPVLLVGVERRGGLSVAQVQEGIAFPPVRLPAVAIELECAGLLGCSATKTKLMFSLARSWLQKKLEAYSLDA